ncbi:golgin candidate 6 isoform X2 [Cajanus cajan]|uniref:golgin candidate 6 isoform X2 n=1 Tax=Cajanus cajan TaxID=3821 RepID=UPI0010FB1A92|nr:golgin candidate 6 isoform X2 [Cajanus cajan]
MKMHLVSGYKGVFGLVFGNENSSSEDSYVERLLDRISNGKLAEDRRNAITELQAIVSESQAAQLAFGAMGFPVLLSILREEHDDVEMVRGTLETLVSALTPINHAKGSSNEVQPAMMNTDLLSREPESISLLLSLLTEDDFYVRYYTLQLLTALLTNSPQRLQEAILTIPRGITRLMDMLMDREVIRNEALLLLTHLTREAEEIQKIVVFEGAFEKIFSIIKEEGGSDGGVVVQDCLELLNNLLRHNASNQVLLRETLGLDSLISILKLRGSGYTFTQQKALRVIGDLIAGDLKNCDVLSSKFLGEEPQVEPALNSILRIILRTSSMQEFIAADYVFKSFCEKNTDGQSMLASTLIPQPYSMNHAPLEEDVNMSFGSMLLHGLTLGENEGDLEVCGRAASVLSHVLKDNLHCKDRVLQIEIEAPISSLGAPEPLMHRMVKYMALVSSMKSKDGKSRSSENSYIQEIILKLLVTWLADCPGAVHCFLDARPHLTYLLELVSNLSETVCIRGLAAVVLGECVIYNNSTDSAKDAFAIVDMMSQKIGLSSYFLMFDEMQKSFVFANVESSLNRKSFTRCSTASMEDITDSDNNDLSEQKNMDHPVLSLILDSYFVNLVKGLEADIREQIVVVYSHPKTKVAVVPAELEQKIGESDVEYIKRLKAFLEKQCSEIKDLLSRNATLAEDLARTGGGSNIQSEQRVSGSSDKVQINALSRDLQEASKRLEMLKSEKAEVESDTRKYRNLAEKMEADLRSLSDAYNSLEQSNIQLEKQVKALKSGVSSTFLDVEAIKAEAREEAQKESEGELNDLLVCLGQEQSKVDRLGARLLELGEDVDKLLEGIGDDVGNVEDGEDEEDTE